jgi:hypothetical protein
VPVDQRAHRLRQLRGGLALCLAVLLALTPVAQLFPTAALQAAAALAAASHASGDARPTEEPALEVPGNQPNAGILPRLPHLEGGLVPPAQKAVRPRLSATIDPLPPHKVGSENAAESGFHRGSVGTARQPTGPPS